MILNFRHADICFPFPPLLIIYKSLAEDASAQLAG